RHTRCYRDWSSDVCSSDLGVALGFGDHGGGMVAANVEEAAYDSVFTAHDNNRLAGQLRGQKISLLTQLIRAANGLPGPAEHCLRSEERRVGKECQARQEHS